MVKSQVNVRRNLYRYTKVSNQVGMPYTSKRFFVRDFQGVFELFSSTSMALHRFLQKFRSKHY